MKSSKKYLGDSVYVDIDDGNRIVLTTVSNGLMVPSNEIVLELFVVEALIEYVKKYGHST
jgi:hypothetical protein